MKGLDKAEELKELYERVASQYDPDGFRLYFAAQEITGIKRLNIPTRTPAAALRRRTAMNC